ncbi:MAG: hypothetical protein H8F28_00165 [Fibrella sp.]|nr:hypothetical protein [Armatimonadota bacterium]
MIWGKIALAGETAAVASQGGSGSATIVALIGYVVGIVWLLLSYVGMGRSLCRLFGLPSHSRQRPLTREESAARHRVVNGFVLGLAVMAALTYAAAFGTSWVYILLRHLFGGGAG